MKNKKLEQLILQEPFKPKPKSSPLKLKSPSYSEIRGIQESSRQSQKSEKSLPAMLVSPMSSSESLQGSPVSSRPGLKSITPPSKSSEDRSTKLFTSSQTTMKSPDPSGTQPSKSEPMRIIEGKPSLRPKRTYIEDKTSNTTSAGGELSNEKFAGNNTDGELPDKQNAGDTSGGELFDEQAADITSGVQLTEQDVADTIGGELSTAIVSGNTIDEQVAGYTKGGVLSAEQVAAKATFGELSTGKVVGNTKDGKFAAEPVAGNTKDGELAAEQVVGNTKDGELADEQVAGNTIDGELSVKRVDGNSIGGILSDEETERIFMELCKVRNIFKRYLIV